MRSFKLISQPRYLNSITLRDSLVLLAGVSLLAACSAQTVPTGEEPVQSTEAAITATCTLQTVGLPCDPDGAGAATECQGVCWVGTNRQPACRSTQSMGMLDTDLNGRLCGDTTGQDCSRSCENGQCGSKNARLGTACRPNNQSSTCDGLCTLLNGQPACDRYVACPNSGVQGCTLHACGFGDNTTGCQDYVLASGTSCDDGLACTTGDACTAAGTCVPAVNSCSTGAGGATTGTGGASAGGTVISAGRAGAAGAAATSAGRAGVAGGTAATSAGKAGAAGAATTSAGRAGAAGTATTSAGKAGAAGVATTSAGKAGSGGKSGTGGTRTPAAGDDNSNDSEATEITGGGCSMNGQGRQLSWSLLAVLGFALIRRRGPRA